MVTVEKGSIDSISLDSFARGKLREKLLQELDRVLRDCRDPLTSMDPRKIKLEMKLVPSRDRKEIAIRLNTSSTLPARDTAQATLFINNDPLPGARLEVHEDADPDQMRIDA